MNRILKPIVYSIIALAVVSCGISISNNAIYQDGEWVNAQWLGQDIVTLCIAVPLLFISNFRVFEKKRWKWKMVMAGILFYFFYTYTFFTIVAKLTFLYLFHVPIFGLSIIALFLVLSELFNKKYGIKSQNLWVKRGTIIFMLFIATMLFFLCLYDIISHLTISDYKSDTPNGEPALIVYTLDLALVVPLMVMAAIGYVQNRQWAYKLTGVMLAKSATIGFALMAMSISMYVQKIRLDTFLIFLWFFIGILGTVMTIVYLRNLNTS